MLLPDLRNHGLSPHDKSHTYFDMASDIRRLCADRGLSDVTLVGHSMGARAAMLLCLLGARMCLYLQTFAGRFICFCAFSALFVIRIDSFTIIFRNREFYR